MCFQTLLVFVVWRWQNAGINWTVRRVSLTTDFNPRPDVYVTGEITTSRHEPAALGNPEVKLRKMRKREIHTSVLIGWRDLWPWQLPIIWSSPRWRWWGRGGGGGDTPAIWGFTPLEGETQRQPGITRGRGFSNPVRNLPASILSFPSLWLSR